MLLRSSCHQRSSPTAACCAIPCTPRGRRRTHRLRAAPLPTCRSRGVSPRTRAMHALHAHPTAAPPRRKARASAYPAAKTSTGSPRVQRSTTATSCCDDRRSPREIHDVVALSVTLLHVTGGRHSLRDCNGSDTDIADVPDALADAEQVARQARADIRRTVRRIGRHRVAERPATRGTSQPPYTTQILLRVTSRSRCVKTGVCSGQRHLVVGETDLGGDNAKHLVARPQARAGGQQRRGYQVGIDVPDAQPK